MSEALPGVPAAPPEAPVRDAAAVVLYRRAEAGVQVFWLKRGEKLRFAGGFYAFPGGKLDHGDGGVAVAGAEGQEAALRVAAARELFEETGVLVARGAERLAQPALDLARKALLDGAATFADLLAQHQLALDARDFPDAGRWVTPAYLPVRFDARFFLVEAPARQQAAVWPGELSYGAWVVPAAALEEWRQGRALLHPPNLYAMRAAQGFRDPASMRDAMCAQPHCKDFVATRIEFQRGVQLVPLPTPTLPPATHTTAWVLGTGELLVVDPGASDPADCAPLVALLDALAAEGARPSAIVLTHHHGDHVGGAAWLRQRTGLPVWAHALTADRLSFPVQRRLAEGEVLALDGELPMRWRVLHTPGHARGHLVLLDEASRAAVVGDMVAGYGTIVIDPPEGDMAEYLRQLQRLKDLGVRTLYPAHGPAVADGPGKLDEYLFHRAWREGKVLAALSATATSLEDLVPRAYDDVQAVVLPIAERNTLAILEKLRAEGRAREAGGAWALT